jgi:hypothetical protein
MPIRHLLEYVPSLRADDVPEVIAAFDAALAKLGVKDRDDPATLMVAYRIIELVKAGERDPLRLRDAALKSLTSDG